MKTPTAEALIAALWLLREDREMLTSQDIERVIDQAHAIDAAMSAEGKG